MKLTKDKLKYIHPDILYNVNNRWKKPNGHKYFTEDIVTVINKYATANKIDTRYRWSHVMAQLMMFYPGLSVNSDSFEEYVELFFDKWKAGKANNLADSDMGNTDSMLTAITYKICGKVYAMMERRLFLNRTKMAFKNE